MDAQLAINECQPGLAAEFANVSADQQLSTRTVNTYQNWIAQYLTYNGMMSPASLSETNVKAFLSYLVKSLAPSRAKLNQAREAIIFFYEKVLKRPLQLSKL
jgi:hypothetical protein